MVEQTGVLKGRRRRAVDSTVLADAVHLGHRDPADQRHPPRGTGYARVAGQIASARTGHDYSEPGKSKIGWDDPAAKGALVSALVNDANALMAALKGQELEESAAALPALVAV